jgi:hypothetical protein
MHKVRRCGPRLWGQSSSGSVAVDPTADSRLLIDDHRCLVVSEVLGVQTFGVAERHPHAARHRDVWAALHALEEQTRAAVFERLGEKASFATRAGLALIAGAVPVRLGGGAYVLLVGLVFA